MTPPLPHGTLVPVGQGAVEPVTPEPVGLRGVVGWHVAFWVVLAIALVAVAATALPTPSTDGVVALVALAALGVAYAVLAVPAASGASSARARGYLTVLVVTVGLAVVTSPQAGFLLFVAYPQVWFFSDRRREGVGWTVALTVVAAAAMVVRVGASPDAVREVGLSFAVSLGLSLLLGLWISSVIEQSEQRAQLIRELQAARSELAEANHAAGVLAERARMAQEIHDTLTQGLTSIVMLAQAARGRVGGGDGPGVDSLDSIEAIARENLAEARALVAAFTPVPLQDSTLAEALRRLAARFGAETGVDVEVELDPAEAASLTRDREVVVLRAAQEALSNVRKHAAATRVRLRLTSASGHTVLEVTDDGTGFVAGRAGGYGLEGMRRRMEQVGGDVAVHSSPGAGTTVSVRVPTTEAPA